jgi:3-hydroxyisobutyrate dehydrogenase-like beta-hydroxyacid dehydrogenase
MDGRSFRRIAMVGFGEVGGIFGHDLAAAGVSVCVYDRLFAAEESRKRLFQKARSAKVQTSDTLVGAIQDAELVISAITASSAVELAKEASSSLRPGQFYMDMNSVSPETKGQIAEEIGRSGADFVEAAAMAAVKPQRLKVPMLLGGVRAPELARRLQAVGMDVTAVSERIGVASTIKMCRSVVMKGLAALAIESLFAARRYGAEDAVIASFEATYPSMGWAKSLPDTLTRRAVEHSRRRAAEMREVSETLRGVGMNPFMSSSTADLQDWLTKEMEARHFVFEPNEPFSWQAIADLIAGRLEPARETS